MSFLTLVNRLKLEVGASGSDLTTVISPAGEDKRLVTWINSAWMDIQNKRRDWQWMRRTATFPTVTGQPTYTPTQIGLTDFNYWARETFRNYANPEVSISIASPGVVTLPGHNLAVGDTGAFYTTGALPTGLTAGTTYYVRTITTDTYTVSATAGGTSINTSGTQSGTHTITSNNTSTFIGLKSEVFMTYLDYERWRDGYEFGALRQTQSRPLIMTVTPDKSIGVGPFPISGYTILGDYFSVPTEMALDADVPSLPTQYQMAIVYRAMMFYGRYEGAPDVYSAGETEFNRLMARMMADRLPEFTYPGALA